MQTLVKIQCLVQKYGEGPLSGYNVKGQLELLSRHIYLICFEVRCGSKSPRQASMFVWMRRRKEMQTAVFRHRLEDKDDVTFNIQLHRYFQALCVMAFLLLWLYIILFSYALSLALCP